MKTQLANDPFRNPFYNRFNDPVRQRLDDMQSIEYTLWLGERSRAMSLSLPHIPKTERPTGNHRALMSIVIIVVVAFVISAAFLFR